MKLHFLLYYIHNEIALQPPTFFFACVDNVNTAQFLWICLKFSKNVLWNTKQSPAQAYKEESTESKMLLMNTKLVSVHTTKKVLLVKHTHSFQGSLQLWSQMSKQRHHLAQCSWQGQAAASFITHNEAAFAFRHHPHLCRRCVSSPEALLPGSAIHKSRPSSWMAPCWMG